MSEDQTISSFESQLDQLKVITLTDGEVWSARDLMPFAGYERWEKWSNAINRAIASVNASGLNTSDHFRGVAKMVQIGSGAKRQVEDVEVTRYGAYILFQNGDPRKPAIAAAQQYFAVKTREAEVRVPTTPSGAELIALAVIEAQSMLIQKDALIAELTPKAAQADTFRQADGLRTHSDFTNDLKVHAASNYPGVKILRADVFILSALMEIIIGGNTVRNKQPTARAIEAGWVKPKDHTYETNTRGPQTDFYTHLSPADTGGSGMPLLPT